MRFQLKRICLDTLFGLSGALLDTGVSGLPPAIADMPNSVGVADDTLCW